MIIYKAINKKNNKFYIGKTIKNLKNRIHGHKTSVVKNSNFYFHNALRKYGFDNFEWIILYECDNKNVLNNAEKSFISKLQPEYNMTEGGDGGPVRKGKNNGMSKYKNMSYEEIWGKAKAKEKMKKISAGLKKLGNDHPSKRQEIKKKLRKTHNTENVRKIKSEKMKAFGDNHPMRRPECVAKNNQSKIKDWLIFPPNNPPFRIKNLKKFCSENNLFDSCMCQVAKDKRKQHKGWRCKLIEE